MLDEEGGGGQRMDSVNYASFEEDVKLDQN